MNKRFLGALVITILCAASAHAQQNDPRFFHNIDFPSEGSTIKQSQIAFIAGGWAFHCDTGEHPVFAVPALFNLDTNQWLPMTGQSWFQKDHLYRPDVSAAYRALCPKVHDYEGYQLYLTFVPPPGHYRLWIMWDKNSYSRDITIIAG